VTVDLTTVPRGGEGEWWVYIHHAADGSALYVGATKSPRSRQATHRTRSAWWAQVVTIRSVGPFADKAQALDAEQRITRELQPPNNIRNTDREAAHYSAARIHGRKLTVEAAQLYVEAAELRLARARIQLDDAIARESARSAGAA
jgi:predicted GIY-YIG superfamily endonuclease